MAVEVTADTEATAYADIDTADLRAERREYAARTAWAALTDDQKDGALETASRRLDTLDWDGTRASDEQLLEWPRTGTDYSDDAWPTRLVDATMALAFSYAPAFAENGAGDVLNDDAGNGNIKREKVGGIETEYFTAQSGDALDVATLPAEVQRLVAPLLRSTATSNYGSAVVTRGS